MRIITWNINSIRIRLNALQEIINQLNPDIICLQETKCPDDKFPQTEIKDLGYSYIAINGQPAYNGVAILSKVKFTSTIKKQFCNQDDCRHIAVLVNDSKRNIKFKIQNFYVPAGGDEPDPNINQKFAHKLKFLDEMFDYLEDDLSKNDTTVIVGDMNIAPHVNDVWSHKSLINVVSHTDIERRKLSKIINDLKLCDIMRHNVPDEEKVYSWWSYRNRDWRKSNRGRRLDHIWVTKDLLRCHKSLEIYKAARDWERPSDHVPVMIEL